jgi:hypothetical protein
MGLTTPEISNPFFGEVRDHLIGFIERAQPEVEVYPISMPRLVGDILSQAQDLHRNLMQDSFTVSTCIEITTPMHGQTLDVNRLIDADGKLIGIGPRPGYPCIDEQIASIAASAQGKPIVIVEDGAFTGNTIVYLLKRFERRGVNIAGIVLGLLFPKAKELIEANFHGELVVAEPITKEIMEWMPDHDFFPCIPNSGRVIGHKIGDEFYPVYSFNGFSFSVPYVQPFGPMDQWASISDQHLGWEMSLYCLNKTIEIYEMLEHLNGRRITTKDFKAKKPSISIPFACGQKILPRYNDVRILDYLTDTAHEMA